jgi:hypothetical protein
MKYIFNYIVLVITVITNASSQATYIKILDINNTEERARQIEPYKGNFLISYDHIESARQHIFCGIIEIDNQADIIKDTRFIDFSNNLNSIVIDRDNKQIYYTGEPYKLNAPQQSYIVNVLDYRTLDSINRIEVIDSSRIYPIVYQTRALLNRGRLIISGSGNTPENHIMTAYIDPQTLTVDTIVHIGEPEHNYESIAAIEMYTDKKGNLTYLATSSRKISSVIVVGENKNIIKTIAYNDTNCYIALPHGCQLSDGRTVYNRCGQGLPEIVFLADSTYEIVDKFEWIKIYRGTPHFRAATVGERIGSRKPKTEIYYV